MFEAFGLDNGKTWLDIVSRFNCHDVYHLPQYAKTFQINGDGEPLLFYFQSENLKAVNVVMKRGIAKDERFSHCNDLDAMYDIITPYGYGGFLMEGEQETQTINSLNEEYTAYCAKNGIVSEFVRFHPLLENHTGLESIYDMTQLGKTVHMDLSSPEVIYANIGSKTRNRLRKAETAGLRFYTSNSWDAFKSFKDIYEQTMDRNNADAYYYFGEDYYQSVMNDLKGHSIVGCAVFNNEIVAAVILLFCNRKMHIHLTGSRQEYLHLSPVAFLYYQSALWGCQNGLDSAHLGGGVGASEDSLYRFKCNFNKNPGHDFVIGRKMFDDAAYDKLLECRKKDPTFDPDTSFFPAYRA